MISIEITCSMCGELLNAGGHTEFSLDRSDGRPHYDIERAIWAIVKAAKGVYQDDGEGDIYCSKKCADGEE